MIGSETYANAILDAVLGDDHSTTIPSSLQVRLYAGSPLTGGVELSGGGYAPLAASNNTATWAPDGGMLIRTRRRLLRAG